MHTRVLVGGLPSLAEQARQGGTRTEPWVVAVLLGNRRALAEEDRRQLQRVLRGGPACGISVVLVDVPLAIAAAVETVRLTRPPNRDGWWRPRMTGPHVTVCPTRRRPAPRSPRSATTSSSSTSATHAGRHLRRLAAGEVRDRIVLSGLCAPVGFAEGIPVS